jgi:hypothetical protein
MAAPNGSIGFVLIYLHFCHSSSNRKVLLKFLLLERKEIKLVDVPKLLHDIPLVDVANKYHLRFGVIYLGYWAVKQLQRAGAAEVRDMMLVNAD